MSQILNIENEITCVVENIVEIDGKILAFGYMGAFCGLFWLSDDVDMKADYEAYYPDIINRMNLRFLYRMYKEPHTRKRYAIAGLVFPVRFVWERFFG